MKLGCFLYYIAVVMVSVALYLFLSGLDDPKPCSKIYLAKRGEPCSVNHRLYLFSEFPLCVCDIKVSSDEYSSYLSEVEDLRYLRDGRADSDKAIVRKGRVSGSNP